MLALPLVPPRADVAGVMNLYSTEPHTFTGPVKEQASVFASHASGALGVALKFAGQLQFSMDLQSAIASRTVIDQALGILMSQESCTAERAFQILTSVSQRRNVKLRDIASELVTKVSGAPPSVPRLGPRKTPLGEGHARGFRPVGEG
jgi:hypothetical protein